MRTKYTLQFVGVILEIISKNPGMNNYDVYKIAPSGYYGHLREYIKLMVEVGIIEAVKSGREFKLKITDKGEEVLYSLKSIEENISKLYK